MDEQEVRWEHYPHVANYAAARAFVERLVLKGKRPKTVDAYARAVEDLLAYFSTTDPEPTGCATRFLAEQEVCAPS
jgi:hypothetical protein